MMDKEGYEKYRKICEHKHKLIEWVDAEIAKGKEAIDTKEMGEVIDMIKDLAETEKLCMETCYYESVVEAMEDAGEEYRMGYGGCKRMNARYPDGIMHKPYVDQEPYVEDYLMDEWDDRMGYQGGRGGRSGSSSGRGGSRGGNSGSSGGSRGGSMSGSSGYSDYPRDRSGEDRYGSSYNRYREMRRHYNESGDPNDKDEMSMSAREHLMDTAESIRDIWKDADPEMRRKMKADLGSLVNSLS